MELDDSAISEYTYERTLLMEQRNEMLKEMRVSEKRKGKMVSFLFFFVSIFQNVMAYEDIHHSVWKTTQKVSLHIFASEASKSYFEFSGLNQRILQMQLWPFSARRIKYFQMRHFERFSYTVIECHVENLQRES